MGTPQRSSICRATAPRCSCRGRCAPTSASACQWRTNRGRFRCHGSIVWASFERSGNPAAEHYRAGVAFIDVNPELVEIFCARHRQR